MIAYLMCSGQFLSKMSIFQTDLLDVGWYGIEMVGRLVRKWMDVLSLRDSYIFRACTLTRLVKMLMQGTNISHLADLCWKCTKQTAEQTTMSARSITS